LYRTNIKNAEESVQFLQFPKIEQTKLSLSDPSVSATVFSEDLRLLYEEFKLALLGIRNDFLQGYLTDVEARIRMGNIGVKPHFALRYLRMWKSVHTKSRKSLTTGQVLRYLSRGMLTPNLAITRLRNIGWRDSDIRILLADASAQQQIIQARIATRLAVGNKAKAKALEAQAKETERAAAKARSELSHHGSPGQLEKWLLRGLISEKEFRDRMKRLGWPTADIDRVFKFVQQQRAAADDARQFTSAAGPTHKDYKAPIGTLKRWFKAGLIEEKELRSRLEKMGVPSKDVDHYLDDFQKKAPTHAAPAAP
jgi:hypothetical protein